MGDQQFFLKESHKIFCQFAENVWDVFFVFDAEKQIFLYVSDNYDYMFGHSREELYRNPDIFVASIHFEDRELLTSALNEDYSGKSTDMELRYTSARGMRKARMRSFPLRDTMKKQSWIMGIIEDVPDGQPSQGRDFLFLPNNRNHFGSTAAGIGIWSNDGVPIVFNKRTLNITGYSEDNFKNLNLFSLCAENDAGDRLKALLNKQGVLKNHLILFRRTNGVIFKASVDGVLLKFGRESIALVIINDLDTQMSTELSLRRNLERLINTAEGIINIVATIIESRDPYTAGHQKRVANLGTAIAQGMGLSKEVIESVHFAGMIHDIGKISVSTEILSKPHRLSTAEYNLIKTHPEIGYEMINRVDFPYPLADIVFQHHERLNGSGYPKSLRGDDILIEARILAIADVVEAISHPRAYRANFGIDYAINELLENSGTLYDKKAVEICIELFRGKGFLF